CTHDDHSHCWVACNPALNQLHHTTNLTLNIKPTLWSQLQIITTATITIILVMAFNNIMF
ncbi:MAG: hypothetical protein LH478_07790, partial [Chitinophagaceae bacterium]|nr:hypothetical protein [Chitinophagaceae bacterium]